MSAKSCVHNYLDDAQTKLLDKYKHLWKDGKVDKNLIAQILKVSHRVV